MDNRFFPQQHLLKTGLEMILETKSTSFRECGEQKDEVLSSVNTSTQ